MEEQGVVVGVPQAGMATVKMTASAACAGCGACCRVSGSGEMLIEANDPLGVSEGQIVRLAIPSGSVLKASVVVYVFPLLVMLVVGVAAARLSAGIVPARHLQLVGILAGFAGMGLTYYLLRRFYGKKAEEALRPTIIDVAP